MKPTKPASPTVTPPESWRAKHAMGFMGFDDTPEGRLVRLADVLRWLGEHPSPKPHESALEALCEAMPGDVMQWLYRVQPDGYAKPVPMDATFGGMTAAQIEAAKARQVAMLRDRESQPDTWDGFRSTIRCFNGKISTNYPEPTEPGLAALLRCLKSEWAKELHGGAPVLDHAKSLAARLAVPFDKAALHWGWGVGASVTQLHSAPPEPSNWADLVPFRIANSQSEWTTAQRGIAAKEAARRKALPGAKGVAAAMAKELDVSVTRFNDLIRNPGTAGMRETVRKRSA